MPDWTPQRNTLTPATSISSFGLQAMMGDATLVNRSAPAAGALAINRASYGAFFIESRVTVYRIAWENGATVNGNVDVGIYDEGGNRLVSSGSTVQSGASVVQVADITDTVLIPGTYFMAHATDSATATFWRSVQVTEWQRLCGVQWEDTAFPLPATATMSTIAAATSPALSLLLRSEV